MYMNYLFLAIALVIGFVVGRWSTGAVSGGSGKKSNFAFKKPAEMKNIRSKARRVLSDRTRTRKEKILYVMKGEAVHDEELKACGVTDITEGLTSANVEKLIGVSNNTALKYLNELESEGKVRQVGVGRGVYYVLK